MLFLHIVLQVHPDKKSNPVLAGTSTCENWTFDEKMNIPQPTIPKKLSVEITR
jgi:hypothetical protein